MMGSNHKLFVASLGVAGLLLPLSGCSSDAGTSADGSVAPRETTSSTAGGDSTVATSDRTAPAFVSVVDPTDGYAEDVKGVVDLELGDKAAGASPICLASGAGSLWAGLHRAHAITRIDPSTGEILAEIGIDPAPGSVAKTEITVAGAARGTGSVLADDDEVWALDIDGFAWAVDTHTNDIVGRVDIPGLQAESGLVRSDGDLFATTETGYVRIDGETRTIEHTGDLEMKPATYQSQLIAVAGGYAWIRTEGALMRVNLADDTVQEVEDVAGDVAGVADGLLWLADEHEIIAVRAMSGMVAERIAAPEEAGALQVRAPALIEGRVWTIGQAADPSGLVTVNLVRYDLADGTFSITPVMTTDGYFIGVAPVADDAWLADWGRGNVVRVDLTEAATPSATPSEWGGRR